MVADLTLVVIGSVLAGFATAGMTGVVAIRMIGVICGYIGLPFAALAVLFIAIDPLSDTMRTAVNVAAANAFAALGCRDEHATAQPGTA